MLDFFKELSETARARIRSPFIGSIGLVFITLNWKAIAVLLFADGKIEDRILAFDQMTGRYTLVYIPVILGLMLALFFPWLKLAGAWISRKPAGLLFDMENSEVLRRAALSQENNSKSAENKVSLGAAEDAATEDQVLAESKFSKEAADTEPYENQRKISTLSEVQKRDMSDFVETSDTKTKNIIQGLGLSRNGTATYSGLVIQFGGEGGVTLQIPNHRKEKHDYLQSLLGLETDGYIHYSETSNDQMEGVFEITSKGYELYDLMKASHVF